MITHAGFIENKRLSTLQLFIVFAESLAQIQATWSSLSTTDVKQPVTRNPSSLELPEYGTHQ
jgi:hypothetical protein